MIEFILASALLVTPQEEATALRLAEEQTYVTAARKCVATQSLRFAQYSNETAAFAAKYAVRGCMPLIERAYKDPGMVLNLADGIEKNYALQIAQWRVAAKEEGNDKFYETIKREIETQFGISAEPSK